MLMKYGKRCPGIKNMFSFLFFVEIHLLFALPRQLVLSRLQTLIQSLEKHHGRSKTNEFLESKRVFVSLLTCFFFV
jgi:hypothetical protein